MKRVALILVLLLLVPLSIGGCAETYCEKECPKLRKELIENFGVPPEEIDCSDDKWVGDCAHCGEVLQRDYAVNGPHCP